MAFLDIFGCYYFKTNIVIFTITNFFAACEECLKVLMVVTKFAKQSSIVAFFAVFCSYISKEINLTTQQQTFCTPCNNIYFFTPLQKDCYDFYIIIQKNFSQILRHIIRLFNNKIGFCSKYSWVQKYIARMQKFIVSMM